MFFCGLRTLGRKYVKRYREMGTHTHISRNKFRLKILKKPHPKQTPKEEQAEDSPISLFPCNIESSMNSLEEPSFMELDRTTQRLPGVRPENCPLRTRFSLAKVLPLLLHSPPSPFTFTLSVLCKPSWFLKIGSGFLHTCSHSTYHSGLELPNNLSIISLNYTL